MSIYDEARTEIIEAFIADMRTEVERHDRVGEAWARNGIRVATFGVIKHYLKQLDQLEN